MASIEAVLLGAGQRGRDNVGRFAEDHPEELKFVAVADPVEGRRKQFAQRHNIPEDRCFASYDDLLELPQMTPVCFNATMDLEHRDSALKALARGYHLFLEKPMATDPLSCLEIQAAARKAGRMVQICHPLRYTTFYQAIKRLLEEGRIGKILSLSMYENIGYWHYAHSYVRGNWANSGRSGPLILTKCCHDMDIATWMADQKVQSVSSFGTLTHFRRESAPEGAPERCTDGCPAEATCPFYAPAFYLRGGNLWPVSVISLDPSPEARLQALKEGPYGRCVFHSDNDVPDHQVVNVQLTGGITLDFAVRAHTYYCFRTIRILGTEGELNGHMEKGKISIDRFQQGLGEEHPAEHILPRQIEGGHGGGDPGVIRNFLRCYRENDFDGIEHSLQIAVEGHLLSFAAEEARRSGAVVDMDEFKNRVKQAKDEHQPA